MLFNPTLEQLYDYIHNHTDMKFSNTGALLAYSGKYTGRKPAWKKMVLDNNTKDIWWGPVNNPISEMIFSKSRNIVKSYLFNPQNQLFCIDSYLNWNPLYQKKIRLYTKKCLSCAIF